MPGMSPIIPHQGTNIMPNKEVMSILLVAVPYVTWCQRKVFIPMAPKKGDWAANMASSVVVMPSSSLPNRIATLAHVLYPSE